MIHLSEAEALLCVVLPEGTVDLQSLSREPVVCRFWKAFQYVGGNPRLVEICIMSFYVWLCLVPGDAT